MISNSTLFSRRPGATLAGIFSLALSSVVLLCGAGLTPTGNVQNSDINANGHNLTNAATVNATNIYAGVVLATNSVTTGTVTTGTLTVSSAAALPSGTTVGGVPVGGLTLGPNASAGPYLTVTTGTLDFSNAVNTTGGLAAFAGDGSIAWLGTTDSGVYSIAIGSGSSSISTGVAIGQDANINGGGGAIGYDSGATQGAAIGNQADETNGGGAIGQQAHATFGFAGGALAVETGGGIALGLQATATTGVAAGEQLSTGLPTTETGGGANFCGGTYAGTGIAINADEIAVYNGSGFATLTGLVSSTAPATSSSTGIAGQFAYNANYLYVCVAANTWKRVSLTTF